jgi:SAM-dependent methyltransferase
LTFRRADARALPFDDATFDRAFSLLVLPFIPDVERAVAEMRRVVRPGGAVVAAALDLYGGMPAFRLFYDTAAALDTVAEAPRALLYPMTVPGEMSEVWHRVGLTEVAETSFTIRIEFTDFEDYWRPLEGRDGPFEALQASLSQPARTTLRDHVRRGFLSNRLDGLRSFAATALACRGIVPG